MLGPNERAIVRSNLANAVEEDLVLSVLAEAASAMLAEAYAGFGLEMPATLPPNLPQCRGCDPFAAQKRTRGKAAAFFA